MTSRIWTSGEDNLTYIKDHPPRRAGTFGHVHGAQVCRIGDDGEDFTLETNRRAKVVFGFEVFAAGFSEGMTGREVKESG